jgi:hypothetical protein
METAPLIEQDEARINPDTNPLGIARAEVRAWKASDGVWHPVAGEAWWDEYAPLSEDWAPDESGRRAPTGRFILDPAWRRMSRVMIAKCAEAQALRRGWPDLLSGLYGEEELHALRCAEQTASEMLRAADEEALRRQIGKRTLWFVFESGGTFQPATLEQIPDRLRKLYESAKDAAAIEEFEATNRASLSTFWEWAPGEALALKRISEARRETLSTTPRARTAHPNSADRHLNGEGT